ncbi:type III secretion system export apparatus switch protein Spa40/SpaS, partial [Shigella boydii]
KYANEVGIPTVRDVKLARKLYKTHTKYSFVDFEHLDEVLRLIVWLEQVENTH